jgi:hypothetical protein
MGDGMYMLGEQKLGVEHETEISDLRLPWYDGVVEAKWRCGYWPASGE